VIRRIAFGAVFLGAGIVAVLALAGVVDLSCPTWVGVSLVLLGLASATVPGGNGLLTVVGILVILVGLPALVVDPKLLDEGVGNETEAPQSAADIEKFEHGIGKLTVDLTAPGLELDGRAVEAELGIGELVVLVPDDTDVSFDVHVGAGSTDAFGETESGWDVDVDGITGTSGSQEVRLEVDVGAGHVRVARGS
jgi:hypothetical protein